MRLLAFVLLAAVFVALLWRSRSALGFEGLTGGERWRRWREARAASGDRAEVLCRIRWLR